jgi:hypothetical protein
MTESEQTSFEEKLDQVKKMYTKFGSTFDPKTDRSYKRLEKYLSAKEQMLYFLIRKVKPSIVLETGVAAGVSSGYILKAMHDNTKGQLYSIDLPFQWYTYGDNNELHLDSLPYGQTSGYLVPENLRKRWKLIIGNTYDKLPQLVKNLKNIDIFLHDSEHTFKTMMFEYNTAWPNIKRGGILLSDDIHFTKAFNTFSQMKKAEPIEFRELGVLIK